MSENEKQEFTLEDIIKEFGDENQEIPEKTAEEILGDVEKAVFGEPAEEVTPEEETPEEKQEEAEEAEDAVSRSKNKVIKKVGIININPPIVGVPALAL